VSVLMYFLEFIFYIIKLILYLKTIIYCQFWHLLINKYINTDTANLTERSIQRTYTTTNGEVRTYNFKSYYNRHKSIARKNRTDLKNQIRRLLVKCVNIEVLNLIIDMLKTQAVNKPLAVISG